MKVRVKGRHLHLLPNSHLEKLSIMDALSWEDTYKNEFYQLYTLQGNEIVTYWGLLDYLKSRFEVEDIQVETDYTPILLRLGLKEPQLPDADPNILDGITLYPHQLLGVQKSLMWESGMIEVATGGGKTEMFLATIKEYLKRNSKGRWLIIVPSRFLLEQTYSRALSRGFPESMLGMYGNGRKELNQITIAIINSLDKGIASKNSELLKYLSSLEGVVIDEAHHIRASSYVRSIMKIQPKYLFGYSGSPFKEDISENFGDAVVMALTGGVIHRVPMRYLIQHGYLAKMYYFLESTPGTVLQYPTNWHKVYDTFVVNNKERNKKIVQWVKLFQEWNIPTLVLVERLEHGKLLLSMLESESAICVFGSKKGGTWIYDETTHSIVQVPQLSYEELKKQVESGKVKTIIASQVMDEGVDLPDIGAIILAGAGKSRIKFRQRIGRGSRKGSLGVAFVVDFYDRSHVYLLAQSKHRIKMYEEQGIERIKDRTEFISLIAKTASGGSQ